MASTTRLRPYKLSSPKRLSARGWIASPSLHHLTSRAHSVVNLERNREHRKPLQQSKSLDTLARLHAQHMAQQGHVASPFEESEELRQVLNTDGAAENSFRFSMTSLSSPLRSSILNAHVPADEYDEVGIGLAKGPDGKIYACQLFRKHMGSSS